MSRVMPSDLSEIALAADWVADIGTERMRQSFAAGDVIRLRRLCEGDPEIRRHVAESGEDWSPEVLVERAEEIAGEHGIGGEP